MVVILVSGRPLVTYNIPQHITSDVQSIWYAELGTRYALIRQ